MAALTSLRIVAAGLIGFVAWHGMLWAIPLSLIAPSLIALQPTRLAAAGTSVAYYAAASLPMIAVARSHWPGVGRWALLPWITAAALLSLPWIVYWTPRESRRPWTTAAAMALTVVPPLCIIGWASPLVSAGVLFPNTGWFGILATLALPSLLICGHTRDAALFTAIAASLVCNLNLNPFPVPRGWEAESTCIRRQQPADELAEFTIEQRLQDAVISSRQQFLVFPEGAVRRWTAATDEFWEGAITGSGKTVLVGAGIPLAGERLYSNSLVIFSETGRVAVHQRIPVPGGMWNPFVRDGFAMDILGNGMADVGGQRLAVLICYEQLLVWPMLRSAAAGPTLLVGISNLAWCPSRTLPAVQLACLRSWARLFRLPVLSATNT